MGDQSLAYMVTTGWNGHYVVHQVFEMKRAAIDFKLALEAARPELGEARIEHVGYTKGRS